MLFFLILFFESRILCTKFDKPGFYGVRKDMDSGKLLYEKISIENRKRPLINNQPITTWDFREVYNDIIKIKKNFKFF
jgi:hypothetical protein